MADMGSYCKAYLAKQLREFAGWSEDVSSLRPAIQEVDGEEVETPRTAIDDEDILYVQEDYIVTDDVFRDEHVVFSAVTDEWKAFCHDQLGFEVPVFEIPEIPVESPAEPGDGAAPAGA